MRRRIINLLYANRLLKWLLPVFHYLIGGFRVKGTKRLNSIDVTDANVYHSSIYFRGVGNDFSILQGQTSVENTIINIHGNNNKIVFGAKSFLNGIQLIIEGDNNECYFGNNVFIMGATRIYIVDGSRLLIEHDCMFSDNIEIRTTDNHAICDLDTGGRINFEEDVILHQHVWIGTGVKILKGAEIEEGCVVGAGSVITRKHLTSNCIIAGNPGREIKRNIAWKFER